jgi:hypothetical protein
MAKLVTAFFIFSISGSAHMLVGWRLGDRALERDLYVFWINFAAIGFELTLSRLGTKIDSDLQKFAHGHAPQAS